MNLIQWAVWGAYLTSMGSYLASVGLATRIGIFYAMQGIVSIFMPTLMGIVADKFVPAQKLLGLAAEAKKAKDFAGAATYYQQALELDPANGGYAIQLGQVFITLKNWDAADNALNTAMANGQEKNATKLLAQLYLNRCQESLKASKLQEAVDFANKSNEYVPSANAYKLGASAAVKMNNLPVAEEMYLKYLELKPNASDASDIKVTLAETYRKAGNKAKAREYFQMLVNDPKYGTVAKQVLPTLK